MDIRCALFLLAAVPATALAQIHMCEGPDGRKVFSDVPCGPNSRALDVRPAMGGASVNPTATMAAEYYDIRGTTFQDLRREIASQGPEGWWGMASTRLTYQLTTRDTPDGCGVNTVRASAESKVRLPRWVNRFDGTAAVQDEWDSAFRSLELHERGHVRISVDAARELERAVLEIAPQPTCALVHDKGKRLYQEMMALERQRQITYDAEGQHGVTQWSPYRR